MLAKQFRFHGHNSLRYVYTKGRQVRVKQVSLKYIRNQRRQESRLAIVVSKKVTKLAPVRNRIRRRMYEAVRLRWSMISPGYDIVITIFDDSIASMESDQLNQLVDQLLQRSELYKN